MGRHNGASSARFVVALLLAFGCSLASSSDTPAVGSTGSTADDGIDNLPESSSGEETGTAVCTRLFGRPTENSGLGPDECVPACPCLGDWRAPEYTEADFVALESFQLTTPTSLLESDPYETPEAFPLDEASVCGVLVDGTTYSLRTFATDADADAAGATVTHDGACGMCSTLQDLAVYMRNPDLTQPVRACGLTGLADGEEAQVACLRGLGFTEPCAQIWSYNTTHTRTVCLDVCLELLDAPYHQPDGSLNACLQCDEERSGPVFKAVAGRTRRNTGLASALCRPCDEVRRVVHRYE